MNSTSLSSLAVPVLLWAAVCGVSGCAKRMTVQEYVLSKVPSSNIGFVAALDAANAGQTAFNLNADTPILDMQEGTEVHERLVELLTKSRDAFRKASSSAVIRGLRSR
ncbi:MAG TPA: hypothetical protein PKE31_15635 [Pseudomonadota bacterium]|nr:hypothetical protein [Pseudomonadota bacterium]